MVEESEEEEGWLYSQEDESPEELNDFILCIDPQTLRYFWINMSKNYFQFEDIDDENLA